MKKVTKIFFPILVCSAVLSAATHLSDDIGNRTFEPSGNPYIVDQDVVVPKDTKVVLKAGTVFLFKSFTGINVYGSLLVEGTIEAPIIFSSINDASQNPEATQLPNAFDWNGIYIGEESGDIKFRNFHLMFSVFGIKSKKDQITIQNGQFRQNGQFHFTINDNIHYVQDNISYSYNVEKSTTAESAKDNTSATVDKKKKPKEASTKPRGRKIAAITTLGVGIASGITCIITGIKAVHYQEDKDKAYEDNDEKLWDELNEKFLVARGACITSGVVCGISLPVSLFLFVKKDKSTMTQKVSLNFTAGKEKLGVGITGRF